MRDRIKHLAQSPQFAFASPRRAAGHWVENQQWSLSMNKTDLIQAVADAAELTKADASRALEAFFATVQKSLKKGDDVSVVGFGTFTVRKRAARVGRNPRTNEAIKIKASKVPAFKAGKTLKDALN